MLTGVPESCRILSFILIYVIFTTQDCNALGNVMRVKSGAILTVSLQIPNASATAIEVGVDRLGTTHDYVKLMKVDKNVTVEKDFPDITASVSGDVNLEIVIDPVRGIHSGELQCKKGGAIIGGTCGGLTIVVVVYAELNSPFDLKLTKIPGAGHEFIDLFTYSEPTKTGGHRTLLEINRDKNNPKIDKIDSAFMSTVTANLVADNNTFTLTITFNPVEIKDGGLVVCRGTNLCGGETIVVIATIYTRYDYELNLTMPTAIVNQDLTIGVTGRDFLSYVAWLSMTNKGKHVDILPAFYSSVHVNCSGPIVNNHIAITLDPVQHKHGGTIVCKTIGASPSIIKNGDHLCGGLELVVKTGELTTPQKILVALGVLLLLTCGFYIYKIYVVKEWREKDTIFYRLYCRCCRFCRWIGRGCTWIYEQICKGCRWTFIERCGTQKKRANPLSMFSRKSSAAPDTGSSAPSKAGSKLSRAASAISSKLSGKGPASSSSSVASGKKKGPIARIRSSLASIFSKKK